MIDWYILRPEVIDSCEAVDKPAAEAIARRRHGSEVIVQSRTSWEVSEEERRAARQRRKPVE